MTIYSAPYFRDPSMTVIVESHRDFTDPTTCSVVPGSFDVWVGRDGEGQTEESDVSQQEALRIAKEISA